MRAGSLRARRVLWLVALLSWGAVAVALVLQHGFAMKPCIWCVLQRLIFLIVGALAIVGSIAWPAAPLGRVFAGAAALAGAAGVAAALYQQFVAAQTSSCPFGIADKLVMALDLDESLPWLFKATASCSEANLPLFGLPFALWSAALFAVLVALSARAAWPTSAG